MRIITISRQFGSGGRELGKRLAETLGWDYYDKNIIKKLCELENMDEEYVKRLIHENGWAEFTQSNRGSFAEIGVNSGWQLSLLAKQRDIIENIAKKGRDCVIVGRDADVILRDYRPFRVFVNADMDFRLNRCLEREQKKEGKKLTEKQIRSNIRRIDRMRNNTREILTGMSATAPETFDVVLNSASWKMDVLVNTTANLAKEWFEQCTRTEI